MSRTAASSAANPTESYALGRNLTKSHAARLDLPATLAGCYEMIRPNSAICAIFPTPFAVVGSGS